MGPSLRSRAHESAIDDGFKPTVFTDRHDGVVSRGADPGWPPLEHQNLPRQGSWDLHSGIDGSAIDDSFPAEWTERGTQSPVVANSVSILKPLSSTLLDRLAKTPKVVEVQPEPEPLPRSRRVNVAKEHEVDDSRVRVASRRSPKSFKIPDINRIHYTGDDGQDSQYGLKISAGKQPLTSQSRKTSGTLEMRNSKDSAQETQKTHSGRGDSSPRKMLRIVGKNGEEHIMEIPMPLSSHSPKRPEIFSEGQPSRYSEKNKIHENHNSNTDQRKAAAKPVAESPRSGKSQSGSKKRYTKHCASLHSRSSVRDHSNDSNHVGKTTSVSRISDKDDQIPTSPSEGPEFVVKSTSARDEGARTRSSRARDSLPISYNSHPKNQRRSCQTPTTQKQSKETVFAGTGWISPHPLSEAPTGQRTPPQSVIKLPACGSQPAGRLTYTDWLAIQRDEATGHSYSVTKSHIRTRSPSAVHVNEFGDSGSKNTEFSSNQEHSHAQSSFRSNTRTTHIDEPGNHIPWKDHHAFKTNRNVDQSDSRQSVSNHSHSERRSGDWNDTIRSLTTGLTSASKDRPQNAISSHNRVSDLSGKASDRDEVQLPMPWDEECTRSQKHSKASSKSSYTFGSAVFPRYTPRTLAKEIGKGAQAKDRVTHYHVHYHHHSPSTRSSLPNEQQRSEALPRQQASSGFNAVRAISSEPTRTHSKDGKVDVSSSELLQGGIANPERLSGGYIPPEFQGQSGNSTTWGPLSDA